MDTLELMKKIAGELADEFAKEPSDRDDSQIAKLLTDQAEAIEAVRQTGGLTGTKELADFAAQIEQLRADVDKQAEQNRTYSRAGLSVGGGRVECMGFKEIMDLRRVGRVFRHVDQAEQFGAVAAKTIFGGRADYKQLVSERARGMADEITKDLDPGVSTAGAELVPNIYMADLIAHVEAVGVLFSRCDRVPLQTTGQTIWPKLTGELTAYPTAVAAQIAASAPTFTTVTLTPVKWATLTPVPNEFFRNPQLLDQLGQRLAWLITRAIGYAFDNALVNGDGTSTYGGITGLLQDANLTVVTAAAHTTLATYDGKDCGTVIAGLAKDYVNDPYWMFSLSASRTLRNIRAVDAAGNQTGPALFQRGGDGEPNTIDDYPYTLCQRFPAAASATAAVKWGAFGDLQLSHYFGLLGSIQVDQSEHARFENDMTVIRGIAMADCKVKDADATIVAKTHA